MPAVFDAKDPKLERLTGPSPGETLYLCRGVAFNHRQQPINRCTVEDIRKAVGSWIMGDKQVLKRIEAHRTNLDEAQYSGEIKAAMEMARRKKIEEIRQREAMLRGDLSEDEEEPDDEDFDEEEANADFDGEDPYPDDDDEDFGLEDLDAEPIEPPPPPAPKKTKAKAKSKKGSKKKKK